MRISVWVWGIILLWSLPLQAKIEVIDGDSLRVNGVETRLEGIDAPEYHQECYDEDNRPYPCGDEAYQALLNLAGDDTLCNQTKIDRYKRSVSVCVSQGKVLNEEMVRLGQAVAYTQYTDAYVSAEQEARQAKRGIWRGRFMNPELYRALMR